MLKPSAQIAAEQPRKIKNKVNIQPNVDIFQSQDVVNTSEIKLISLTGQWLGNTYGAR